MAYKPKPNNRKHRRLIGEALAIAELVEQDLHKLSDAARNDQTKAHIVATENNVLRLEKTLFEMMEIARGE